MEASERKTPELRGKLDTVMVNGPEDDVVDWEAVSWSRVEDDVRRLRQRIFTATQAGDHKRVRNVQKLLPRSRANALVSVRRVIELNAGRKTAGVDGRLVLTGWEKAEMAAWLQRDAYAWKPRPVKRVFIPKANGKRRGLGIPVIADRALQALVKNALEPEWEARFESRSYGFRPGRGCQDAMQAVCVTARGATCRRQWALDADLAAAFDRIDHDQLLDRLGWFPARGMIAAWLRAGVIEEGRFAPTERGSPQGRKKGKGSTGHGNRYLARALGEAAVAAGKTNTFLGERYRRLARRRGKKRAIVALGRSILVIAWHLLSNPAARFTDLGPDFYDNRTGPEAKKRNHIRQLEALGYKVTLEPAA